ncbi:hypothetical protein LOZ66_003536 [Ophidiomyces ophidiicola]|nr:hypothetical protein LOZ66_003536 [Ophidiomyces ophidiicola]
MLMNDSYDPRNVIIPKDLWWIAKSLLITVNIPTLPYNDQCRLFANLSDIYLQLFQHQLNHIGALTLDSTDEK